MKISKNNIDTKILYVAICISAIILIGCIYCAYAEYQLAFAGKNIIN